MLLLGAALVAALVVAGPAQATDPNSQFDQPALGQYIETLPGSGGPTAPGIGGRGNGRGGPPLSPHARAALRQGGGSLGAPLRQLATSRRLGAPPPSDGKGEAVAPRDDQSVLRALADAAAPESGPGGTLWLLVALGAVTALAAGLATRNRRQGRRLTG